MPDKDQLKILRQGIKTWNKWRKENPNAKINLRNAELEGADLRRANFEHADLRLSNLRDSLLTGANFRYSNLGEADISETSIGRANFSHANLSLTNLFATDLTNSILSYADLYEANLSCATLNSTDFSYARLAYANLSMAELERANLNGADLEKANLSEANLRDADISNCYVYGTSAWNVNLENTKQLGLIITQQEFIDELEFDEPNITVDDLEIAQFVHLLINNRKIKNIIDSVTSKVVLILGRFTLERKIVLDALRDNLRKKNYVPIIFDFERPSNRDLTETITLLARMSRFIIADLSDPKSIPQELTSIIPELPSIPVQPIMLDSQKEYSMYEHWFQYPWVLKIHKYKSINGLISELNKKIIEPPEKRVAKTKRGVQ